MAHENKCFCVVDFDIEILNAIQTEFLKIFRYSSPVISDKFVILIHKKYKPFGIHELMQLFGCKCVFVEMSHKYIIVPKADYDKYVKDIEQLEG